MFIRILTTLTAKEQFWLSRIILKDTKMSCTQNTMFKIFHPLAMELYNTCSDLKHVCEQVSNVSACTPLILYNADTGAGADCRWRIPSRSASPWAFGPSSP